MEGLLVTEPIARLPPVLRILVCHAVLVFCPCALRLALALVVASLENYLRGRL